MNFRQGIIIVVLALALNVSAWPVIAQDAPPDDITNEPGTRLSYAISGLAPNKPVSVTLRASNLLAQDLNTTTTDEGTLVFENVDISNLDNKQTTLTATLPVIFSFEWDDRNDNFVAEDSELTPLFTTINVSMNLERFSSDMTVTGTGFDDLSDPAVQFGALAPGTQQVTASNGFSLNLGQTAFSSLPLFDSSILDGTNDTFMQITFTDGGLERNQIPRRLAPVNTLDVLGGVNSSGDAQPMEPVRIQFSTTSVDDIPNGKGNSGLGNFLFGTILAGGLGVVVSSLQDMTTETSVRSQARAQAKGTFIDVDQNQDAMLTKSVLDAQNTFMAMPSEQMCNVASSMQGLAQAQSTANKVSKESAAISSERDGGIEGSPTASGPIVDYQIRYANYLERYCRPDHNNNGMQLLCGQNDPDDPRRDRDINVGFLLSDDQMTLDINYSDPTETEDEKDVEALKQNLYGSRLTSRIPADIMKAKFSGREAFMEQRSIRATRNALRLPYEREVGRRAKTQNSNSTPFLYAMLDEYNVAESDMQKIRKKYGENPSLHAQYTALVRDAMINENDMIKLIESKRNVSSMTAYKSALRMAMNFEELEQSHIEELTLALWLERLIRREESQLSAQLAGTTR